MQEIGQQLINNSNLMKDEIEQRLQQLGANWDELRQMAVNRGQKLEESLAYQQFAANVEEEEAWIAEKQHLLSGGDYGDTLAAVQVCIITFISDFLLGKTKEILYMLTMSVLCILWH